MSSAQITALTLAGFQVFSEPCRVPFGRFTLLYGPGSAGKTAIGHALGVVNAYCGVFRAPGRNQAEDLGERLAHLLDRHWRQVPSGSAGVPAMLAPELLLDLRLRAHRQAWAMQAMAKRRRSGDVVRLLASERRFESLLTAMAPWFQAAEAFELGFQLRAQRPDARVPVPRLRGRGLTPPALRHVASVLIDGEPVLRVDSHGAITLRLSHPALGGRLELGAITRLTARYPTQCAADADWFSVIGGDHLRSIGLASGTLAGLTRMANPQVTLDATDLQGFSLLEGCINGLWLSSTRMAASATDLVAVSDDRGVAAGQGQCYLMDGAGQEVPTDRFGLHAPSRPEYGSLAAEGLWESVRIAGKSDLARPNNVRSELEHVNRLLCEVLYRDRGLYLCFEVHEISGLELHGQGLLGQLQDRAESRSVYAVNLKVGDADGRRLPLAHSGGGLAHVLPVVVALARNEGTWVQHPELQLPPALHAQLADAYLLSGSGKGTQHLIETHSEMFLLRLLRRIRQGLALDQVPNPALEIKAHQLKLVHVGPGADGVTRVKAMRVAPDGEIIDRWPGGFFEDRWQELFDE